MNRLAAIILGATACGLLGLLGGVLIVANDSASQAEQITQLRGELAQVQHQVSNEQSQVQTAVSAAEQRIGGVHRDLITCSDFKDLIDPLNTTMTGATTSLGGTVFFSTPTGPGITSSGSSWLFALPAHCINQ